MSFVCSSVSRWQQSIDKPAVSSHAKPRKRTDARSQADDQFKGRRVSVTRSGVNKALAVPTRDRTRSTHAGHFTGLGRACAQAVAVGLLGVGLLSPGVQAGLPSPSATDPIHFLPNLYVAQEHNNTSSITVLRGNDTSILANVDLLLGFGNATSLAFSADTQRLYVGTDAIQPTGNILVLDTAPTSDSYHQFVNLLSSPDKAEVTGLVSDPLQRFLAVARKSKARIEFFNVAVGSVDENTIVSSLSLSRLPTGRPAISPKGDTLAWALLDANDATPGLALVDTGGFAQSSHAQPTVQEVNLDPKFLPRAISFSTDGHIVFVSNDFDSNVYGFDRRSGVQVMKLLAGSAGSPTGWLSIRQVDNSMSSTTPPQRYASMIRAIAVCLTNCPSIARKA